MEWLKSLGPVVTDYTLLTLKFMKDNQLVELKGRSGQGPKEVTRHQLKLLVHTNRAASFFHIQMEPTPNSTPNTLLSPSVELFALPSAMQPLLSKFSSLFHQPHTLPPARSTDHSIHLFPDAKPVNVCPYRYPYFQKQEIEKQVAKMLQNGMIQPSRSPFSSPVLLVRKKDDSWHFCVDFRALNAITVKDRFPIPTIDELLDDLGSASWFFKIDLAQGFHQILMTPADVPKTAFRTHQGHYEYRVMPFGLCNAPSTFQATMNELLKPFLRRFALVFFDDILIFSTSLEDHLIHLERVFQTLHQGQFFLKFAKCAFAQRRIEYLGHIVSSQGVEPVPAKIQAMQEWPTPSSLKMLRGFLGLTGFYRKFIKDYSKIASPLTELLRKDRFHWNPEAQIAFEYLKLAMTHAPVLSLPDFKLPFLLKTDASGTGMEAILMQNHHPIAFFSKQFCPKLLCASTYIRELHAITTAIKRWGQYLLGHPFIILTDHCSLKELMSQAVQTPEQHVYLAKLIGYDYTIQYRLGKQNVVADALSRMHEPTSEASAYWILSMPHFRFLDDLKKELATNNEFISLKHAVFQSPTDHPDFKFSNGLLFYKGSIWLPISNSFLPLLLAEYHTSPLGGHMGLAKTLSRIRDNFFWAGMRRDVQHYITECPTCQHTKYVTKKPPGLLQPIPPPSAPWEDLALDFITGLPPFQGSTVILVVVDRFSKGAHFGILPTGFTAHKVAQLFLNSVCKLHDFPKSLISDRDPVFMSKIWQQLFKLNGTKLRMSTLYHPQSNGQTEVLNRILEHYLRSYVHHQPSLWGKFLSLAEWCYNTTSHSSTGLTPFQVTYGKAPPSIPRYLPGTSALEAVDSLLSSREEMLEFLRRKLIKSQQQMKASAKTHRRDVSYNVGDWVYVKVRPYRQQSLSGSRYQKLGKRYYGPFQISAVINPVAYRLTLPPVAKIHPVFHCSMLKPHHGPIHSSLDLPATFCDGKPLIQPLAILD